MSWTKIMSVNLLPFEKCSFFFFYFSFFCGACTERFCFAREVLYVSVISFCSQAFLVHLFVARHVFCGGLHSGLTRSFARRDVPRLLLVRFGRDSQLVNYDKVDSVCTGGLMDSGEKLATRTEDSYSYTGNTGSCSIEFMLHRRSRSRKCRGVQGCACQQCRSFDDRLGPAAPAPVVECISPALDESYVLGLVVE